MTNPQLASTITDADREAMLAARNVVKKYAKRHETTSEWIAAMADEAAAYRFVLATRPVMCERTGSGLGNVTYVADTNHPTRRTEVESLAATEAQIRERHAAELSAVADLQMSDNWFGSTGEAQYTRWNLPDTVETLSRIQNLEPPSALLDAMRTAVYRQFWIEPGIRSHLETALSEIERVAKIGHSGRGQCTPAARRVLTHDTPEHVIGAMR